MSCPMEIEVFGSNVIGSSRARGSSNLMILAWCTRLFHSSCNNQKYSWYMEDGGVDRTVIDGWQHQLSQMADIPPLLTILVFDL